MTDRLTRAWTFSIVPWPVVADPDLSHGAVRVYAILCHYASQADQTAFPSAATIAAAMGINRRNVYKFVDELVERGYITRETRYGAEGRTSNLYTLTDPNGRAVSDEDGDGSITRVGDEIVTRVGDDNVTHPSDEIVTLTRTNRTRPTTSVTARGDDDGYGTGHLLDVTPTSAPSKPADDTFEQWWTLHWPGLKTGKADARKAWPKAVAKVGVQRLCAEAANLRAYIDATKKPLHLIPRPSTWLNGERWDDELHVQPPHTDPSTDWFTR